MGLLAPQRRVNMLSTYVPYHGEIEAMGRRGGASPESGRFTMTKVQIVYGSRHGGTRGIAERIGEVLEAHGIGATVEPAGSATAADDADAYVVGSGVSHGQLAR